MPDIKMLPSELQELVSDVAHIKLQDFHLGCVLEKFATHLAHAHGLDTAESAASDPESTESEPADDVADALEAGTTTPQKPSKGKK
jgi:hypothetical protein